MTAQDRALAPTGRAPSPTHCEPMSQDVKCAPMRGAGAPQHDAPTSTDCEAISQDVQRTPLLSAGTPQAGAPTSTHREPISQEVQHTPIRRASVPQPGAPTPSRGAHASSVRTSVSAHAFVLDRGHQRAPAERESPWHTCRNVERPVGGGECGGTEPDAVPWDVGKGGSYEREVAQGARKSRAGP